jgi:hypothetical protein
LITLKEIIDRLMKLTGWSQTALGERIGANQSMVSRMRGGGDWEQHWRVFGRLRALCRRYKIEVNGAGDDEDTEKQLEELVLDATNDDGKPGEVSKASPAANRGQKAGVSKHPPGPISPRKFRRGGRR